MPTGEWPPAQPNLASNRFRFCPVAVNTASQFTLASPLRRNRFIPCHSCASPKSGHTKTTIVRAMPGYETRRHREFAAYYDQIAGNLSTQGLAGRRTRDGMVSTEA